MITRYADNLFRVQLPGREKPTTVKFIAREDGEGMIEVVGRDERLCGEFDLTAAGADIFRLLGSDVVLAVMDTFEQELIDFLTPLADKVDEHERDEAHQRTVTCAPSSPGEQ